MRKPPARSPIRMLAVDCAAATDVADRASADRRLCVFLTPSDGSRQSLGIGGNRFLRCSLLLMGCAVLLALCIGPLAAQQPIPSLYTDPARFEAALANARANPLPCATGAIVPHHLLAIDVIAKVFRALASNPYRTIIILTPDHFFASPARAATTTRDFESPFGRVRTASELSEGLIEEGLVADAPTLFRREHGIHAVLPFIAKLFPNARVLPLALSIGMDDLGVAALTERLAPLLTDDVLVLLSSDFSHYLPLEQAAARDQETLNLLAAGDTHGLGRLVQPDHVDSRAGLLVQHRLLAASGAQLVVLQNKNSQQCFEERLLSTTSYVGAVYNETGGSCGTGRPVADLCFGGDFFTGRDLTSVVQTAVGRAAIVAAVRDAVGDCPLVVNFEGVLVPEPVVGAPPLHLWALAEPTLALMRELGVVAVSLANNHSRDFGQAAYEAMRERFRQVGIAVIEHGDVTDLGPVRVLGLSEVTRMPGRSVRTIGPQDLEVLRRHSLRPPVLGLLHWGRQFITEPDAGRLALASELRRLGVRGIIGAHPHRASRRPVALHGGAVLLAYSLGNLLFDQGAEIGDGDILALDVFDQGTFFARQLAIPNLYDRATEALRAVAPRPAPVQPPRPPSRPPPLRQRALPKQANLRISR